MVKMKNSIKNAYTAKILFWPTVIKYEIPSGSESVNNKNRIPLNRRGFVAGAGVGGN